MPGTELALSLTPRVRSRQLARRQTTVRAVTASWIAVTDDLDTAFATWLATASTVVEAAKLVGVSEADIYLAQYVAAERGGTPAPRGLDPEPYMDTIDGRPMGRALSTPLLTVKGALAGGQSLDAALALGLVRATRIVAEEVLATPRRALADLMADHELVKGKRRVVSRNACGACLALATGDAEDPDNAHRTHTSCRCVWEPVVKGVRERFRRPTGREVFDALNPAEQAALFAGRGGEEKADLVRSGAVPFAALATREPQAVTPDQFTEASLADLRRQSTRPDTPATETTTEESRDG
jgi:hypothetical protein